MPKIYKGKQLPELPKKKAEPKKETRGRPPVTKPPKPKAKLGRKPHAPTQDSRDKVKAMAVVGITQVDIARVLNIHFETLEKYYREELDTALTIANTQVGGKLFQKAMAGDTTSILFWLKTRAGFKETNGLELTGKNGGPLGVKIIDDV